MIQRLLVQPGKGFTFPIEMLYSEHCWPASKEDADKIQALCACGSLRAIGKTIVTVTRDSPTKAAWNHIAWQVHGCMTKEVPTH